MSLPNLRPPRPPRLPPPRRLRFVASLLLLAAGLGPSPPARADLGAIAGPMTLFRALAYDANLRQRVGPTFLMAVLFKPGHAASVKEGEETTKVFKKLEVVSIGGSPSR